LILFTFVLQQSGFSVISPLFFSSLPDVRKCPLKKIEMAREKSGD